VLKIRYADFSTLTKRQSLATRTQDAEQIERIAHEIYDSLDEQTKGVRLLGVIVTGFGM
ncbi:DinB/UmuC family translesion DNA polymerase, partial [Streptococcus anginosus]|nr:DNA polymerase IV [Streptococcus anginosus]